MNSASMNFVANGDQEQATKQLAQTLESSDQTSVQRRIEAIKNQATEPKEEQCSPSSDAFLSPLAIDKPSDTVGPCASRKRKRCSDNGFQAMSIEDYLALLDWSARRRKGVRSVKVSSTV